MQRAKLANFQAAHVREHSSVYVATDVHSFSPVIGQSFVLKFQTNLLIIHAKFTALKTLKFPEVYK